MIVIPAVDIRRGRVVRLRQGRADEETSYTDDPAAAAAAFVEVGAEWLHVIDLDAAFGTGNNTEAIERLLSSVEAKIQVGGGIRGLDAAAALLEGGADRLILGTQAVKNPEFLARSVERFGERVVVALDVRGDRVRIRGWSDEAGSLEETLPRVLDAGVSRILVTQVSRDGMLEGPDLALYEGLTNRGPSVIASGGVRHADDLRALVATGVEAAVVGRAFYEDQMTLAEAIEAVA